jgi:murein DD-endopeptidase MepM/ murein hydrolase activator NlpD
MPQSAPSRWVLFVDDGSEAADAVLSAAEERSVEVVVLAGADTPDRSGHESVHVETGMPTVADGFREAATRDIMWVAVAKPAVEPELALTEALVASASLLSEERPAFALLAVEPGRPFHRALLVVDLDEQDFSGALAWAGAAVADRTGSQIDVLLLGLTPEEQKLAAEQTLSVLAPGSRRKELLRQALNRADERGIAVNVVYPSGPVTDKAQAVIDVVHMGNYDVVLDDLGDIDLKGRWRRQARLERLLESAADAAVPRRLLREAPCHVVVAIDAVRTGLIPPELVKVSAAAALGVGVLAPATASALGAAPVTAAVSETGTPGDATTKTTSGDKKSSKKSKDSKSGKDKKSGKKSEKQSDKKSKQDKGPSVPKNPTLDDIQQAQAQTQSAASKQRSTKAELQDSQKELKAREKEAKKAEKRARKTARKAEQSQQELAESTAARQEVERSQEGWRSMLPGQPATDAEVEAARAAEQEAQVAAAVYDAAASAVYNEYQAFAAEVDAIGQDVESEQKALKQANRQLDAARGRQAAMEANVGNPATLGLMRPAAGGINSPYGYRIHPIYGYSKLHSGIDFGDTGSAVAASEGTVVSAGYNGGYGNQVVIDHGMVNGVHLETSYSHLDSIYVSTGQRVSVGQAVGDIGNTGSSTGSHLHFEVLENGVAVDPMTWLA